MKAFELRPILVSTLKNYNRNLTPFLYCGEKTGSLKLLYDGTLVNC